MEDMAEYADRILVMNDAKLVLDGTPAEVFSHYEELKGYGLNVPQVTLAMLKLRECGIPVRTDAITVEQAKKEILRVLR